MTEAMEWGVNMPEHAVTYKDMLTVAVSLYSVIYLRYEFSLDIF